MGLRTVATLLVTLGLLANALPAHAWGDLGHKIICEIAYQELNDKARAEVDRLIGLDTFPSFPESCVGRGEGGEGGSRVPRGTGAGGARAAEAGGGPAGASAQ